MNNPKRSKIYSSIHLRKYRQKWLPVTDWTHFPFLSSQSLFIVSGRVHAVTSWSISPFFSLAPFRVKFSFSFFGLSQLNPLFLVFF